MTWADYLGLVGFLVANGAAAMSGAYFKPGAWYDGLAKPPWQPPKWLFPVAWSILYATIAVAGWLVWLEAGFTGAAVALTVYAVHLVLNALWSALFFGMRRMDLAFYELTALWSSLVAVIALFHAVQPNAAYLLLPYLAWVTFAGVLNWTVWKLNPDAHTRPAG
jgi:benzodiazapine receptor